jgi:hypothetical protein
MLNLNSPEDDKAIQQEVEAEIRDDLGVEPLGLADLEELDDLEAELGLEQVELSQAVIDTVAVDDANALLADNEVEEDGEVQENETQEIDNRPQDLTESYGTGLQGKPSDRAGRSRWSADHFDGKADATLTGGDIDVNYEQASVVGDEAVGGTVATPDQDIVDELAVAVGLVMDDRTDLRTNEILEQRDDRRWELDPQSSEDYEERRG